MKKVIFIGLGTMGYPMSGHLSKIDNIELTVFNRTVERAQQWQSEFNGNMCINLAKDIHDFEVIILCVGRDEDIAGIFFDNNKGIINHIKEGTVVIDHTTTSYDMAVNLANQLNQKNIHFMDAPVSGGEVGAQNGSLSVMAGGYEDTLKQMTPIIDSYSKSITYMGETGSGQLAKMANQICISGVLQGLSEALLFAEKNNLNIDKLLSAISKGAAGSWQMENRLKTMHKREFDFGFAIEWMIKDLAYTLDRAKKQHVDLGITHQVYEKYQYLNEKNCGHLDTSALIMYQEK